MNINVKFKACLSQNLQTIETLNNSIRQTADNQKVSI